MASTKISDVIVPEVFGQYVQEAIVAKFELLMGGAVQADPAFNLLADRGGKLLNMPFWNPLTDSGDDEVLSDSSALTVNPITAGQDIAVLLMRGKAWGVNDLASALSGDDPAGAIVNQVATYKQVQLQKALIESLNGVILDNVANFSSDMVIDVALETLVGQAEANWISSTTVISAIGTLGDAWDKITGMAMHSIPFQRLQMQNQIVYVDATGAVISVPQATQPALGVIAIPTYLGKRVMVDDGLPVVAGTTSGFKYTTVFFGQGAVALGQGDVSTGSDKETETDRDILAGDDILVHRWHTIMHPRGVAFQNASVAGSSPTNAELANVANWSRVYDRKNVQLAFLVTNG